MCGGKCRGRESDWQPAGLQHGLPLWIEALRLRSIALFSFEEGKAPTHRAVEVKQEVI